MLTGSETALIERCEKLDGALGREIRHLLEFYNRREGELEEEVRRLNRLIDE